MKLEDLAPDMEVLGVEPKGPVKVLHVAQAGPNAVNVTYSRPDGTPDIKQLFRDDEAGLRVPEKSLAWTFDAPAEGFKLAAEALRITQAHLFDPMMAIHTADVEALPHQISAVYEHMLQHQPLRFVLADDPGAGKTIMAGLLVRELALRGDVERCLVIAPGSLVEQWQSELDEKFGLHFDLLTSEMFENARTGNIFIEKKFLIARLDQMSRREDWHDKLGAQGADWDLVIFDEAHKLSAHFFGKKLHRTKRYRLAEMIREHTRHLLLMTATPHNGKEEDFQLFMRLVDPDRFGGRFRGGAHRVETSDVMRRMVKEDLLKFDGTKLFPERRAYTLPFDLSPPEAQLYEDVTSYVREQMGRAEAMASGKRRATIGFALTVLQRRLASSPNAIFSSLRRRRERLIERLKELRAGKSSADEHFEAPNLEGELDDDYLDNFSEDELEKLEEEGIEKATTAATIKELEREIAELKLLEAQADGVLRGGTDRKWEELSRLLRDDEQMTKPDGTRRKLIIFTEHKDTLNYLVERIRGLLGRPDALVAISGSTRRQDRLNIQDQFRQNPDVEVLVATDAACEGVNLQTANLMVNYDLPWNPNRIEQRFGRIHRIGQHEVCHLWNLVAKETREGAVFERLFEKLDVARAALRGQVFDVLGSAFENISLRDMLIEAIRYGKDPDKQAELYQKVDSVLDTQHLRDLVERNALSPTAMRESDIYRIRDAMERAEAQKLQPYYLRNFLFQALEQLGGSLEEREKDRYEVKHVPPDVRSQAARDGGRRHVLQKYNRITFDRQLIRFLDRPKADLMHPGHALMAATLDIILKQNDSYLRQGTVLVDTSDGGTDPRLLYLIDHSIREGGSARRDASRRIHMVEISSEGLLTRPGVAPYLDYQALQPEDRGALDGVLGNDWLKIDVETRALNYATETMVPEHLKEVKDRRLEYVEKSRRAVQERLDTEIHHWSRKARELKHQVRAGKQPQVQLINANRKLEDLRVRLKDRMQDLDQQAQLSSSPPKLLAACLLIPQGLIDKYHGRTPEQGTDPLAKKRIELLAMNAVAEAEAAQGNTTEDVSRENCGWDITSRTPSGQSRHIEVKGRHGEATTVTVSHNEVLTAFNQGDKFVLAIVLVQDDDSVDGPHYVRSPFEKEPEPGMASVNMTLKHFLERAVAPADY